VVEINVRAIDPATLKNAPLKAAILVGVAADLMHPEGFLSIIRKDPAAAGKGTLIANLAGAPNKNESDTTVMPFEDLYGKTGDVKGDMQWQSTRAEITFSPVSHTLDVLKLIYPGSKFEDIFGQDAVAATLSVGTGAAGVTYTADATGTGGNSIRVAHINPGAAAALSVVVSGNDITVTLAHSGTALTSTAAQVRDAVNAHAGAAALVNAGLTGDGTGVAVAQAMTALAGGTDGTKVGVKRTSRGRITLTDYHSNVCLVWTSIDKTVAGAYIIREAINVEEDRNYEFSDDGAAFAVDCTLRAHTNGETLDMETGTMLPAFEEHDYSITLPVA
jgi:hypothetical protein